MEKQKAPDVTPEWKTRILSMSPYQKTVFGLALGVTQRTVSNWADGKSKPSDATERRIVAQIKKGTK